MSHRYSKTPLYVIVGTLGVLFVVPFILSVIVTLIYGEFTLPGVSFLSGVLNELDANFVLAMLLTALPLALVGVIEATRRRLGSRRRSAGLTLGLLVLMMVAMTAAPVATAIRPLSALAPGAALAIVLFAALPLLIVTLGAAIVLPGLLRGSEGPPSEISEDAPAGDAGQPAQRDVNPSSRQDEDAR